MSLGTAVETRSPIESQVVPPPPESGDAPYELTADEFLALVETGAFREGSRIYLRDGRIYEKMAKTIPHSLLGSMIATALIRRLPPGWFVIPEGQFKVDDRNSRLPDIAVVRGAHPFALLEPGAFPEAKDLGLIVEISVTSLAKNPGRNLDRYARSGVPSYWVMDFPGRRILAHSGPRAVEDRGEYEHVAVVGPGRMIPLVLDGVESVRFAYEELMP